MIYSMTAYAREESHAKAGSVVWELRSVNHRYLELVLRLPEIFRPIENAIREHISTHISRGKLEVVLHYTPNHEENALIINTTILSKLAAAQREITTHFAELAAPNFLELINWPGVIQSTPQHQSEELKSLLFTSLGSALNSMIKGRAREGETIKNFLMARLDAIKEELAKLHHYMAIIFSG